MIKCKAIIDEKITDDLIKLREKRWRKLLPESFVSFMKQNNGGIPEDKIEINDKWFIERFLCIVPKISESSNGQFDIDAVMTKYDEYMVFDEDSLGADLIPFAQLNHDALLCLCYKTQEPSVIAWQFEGSESFAPKYTVCYDSFPEFLQKR